MRPWSLIALTFGLIVAMTPALQAADDVPWVHGIAMHGALKYGPDFSHFDYVNPDAPKGGKVRLADIGNFDTLNPFTLKGSAASGLGLMYDTLLGSSADEPFSVYTSLAEAVQVPKDRSWVAFRIDPDARWHDGKPVTADDVIFTFHIQMEKGRPSFQFYYAGVDQAIRVDDRTVKFTFKEKNAELPLILGQMQILPKHYWEEREFEKTTLEPPLGSGPYRIKEVDAPRSITYERVADYWGVNKPSHRGFYNFDEIRYDFYLDTTVAIEAFKAGRYDFRAENSSKHWATAYDIDAVKDGRVIRDEVHHERPAGMQAFVFNMRRDLFKDVRVRQALAYTFDFAWANANLFYGQYIRTRSYFENSDLAATGLPGPDELALLEPLRDQVPPEVFTKAYQPPSSDGSPGSMRGNLRQATALLKEAGWVVKDKKLVHGQTGKPFKFEVLLVSPLFERIVLSMKQNLNRLGIDVDIRTVDSSQYIERIKTFDFDVIVNVWGQSMSPGNEQLNFWGSEAADRQGSRNFGGIKNPAADALIAKIIQADDRQSLVAATRALDRVLQWNHYVIPQWHLNYDRLIFWNKFGRPETLPIQGNQFFAWWVDDARAKALNAN